MGAVAQSVRSTRQEHHSKTHKTSAGGWTGGVSVLKDDSADVLKAQIIALEKIRNEKSKKIDNVDKDIASPDINEDERLLRKSTLLKGLIVVLERRIETKYSYLKLLALLTFFCFYSVSFIMQRDISASFGVQSRWETDHVQYAFTFHAKS